MAFWAASLAGLSAETFVAPIDDRCIYDDGSYNVVVDNGYVLADGYIHGALDFANENIPQGGDVYLEVNPYGEPNTANTVNVYGIASAASTIQPSDFSDGVYLGSFTDVSALGFGQPALLDVTSFVRSDTSPYFEFILDTSSGSALFSSEESNYGLPSGLEVVPEPTTWALLGASIVGLLGWRRRPARC